MLTRADYEAQRKSAQLPSGNVSYVQTGRGPAALFVHGLLVNGSLWRHQLDELANIRRCIAIDLLAHGATEIAPTQEVTFDAQAAMLAQFLDVLNIDQVDVVANDSGVGIALIFAANNPRCVRSLTLTNGDVYDNWPPKDFSGFFDMVRQGGLSDTLDWTTRTSMNQTWTLVGPDREPYASDQPGTVGGHRRSRIYGRLDCPAALRAIARGGYVAHRVFFLTEDHARAAGYRPCGVCLPAAYASWKAQQGNV